MIDLKLEASDKRPDGSSLPCERCLCAGCTRTCNQCHRCKPMEGGYIPLIGCPDHQDMRKTALPRRDQAVCEPESYPIHLGR